MEIKNYSSQELAERLILTTINYLENEDKLDDFPYIQKGNFALLAQLCLGEKNEYGDFTACITVTNSMLNKWGIEKNIMFEIAADNSKKLFPVSYERMNDYLEKRMNDDIFELPHEFNIKDIIVLTNEKHFNGAATIFYEPDILEVICKEIDNEKMILMPSSVNQIYCMPYKDDEQLQDLQMVYKEFVLESGIEEALTNGLLTYDCETKQLTEMNGLSYSPDLNEARRYNTQNTRR